MGLLLPINIIYILLRYNFKKFSYNCYNIDSQCTNLFDFNKNYQNIIFGKLFYFILYLCAFEIAPYYFMYYWFTKGCLENVKYESETILVHNRA
jgi:hypothetical protein